MFKLILLATSRHQKLKISLSHNIWRQHSPIHLPKHLHVAPTRQDETRGNWTLQNPQWLATSMRDNWGACATLQVDVGTRTFYTGSHHASGKCLLATTNGIRGHTGHRLGSFVWTRYLCCLKKSVRLSVQSKETHTPSTPSTRPMRVHRVLNDKPSQTELNLITCICRS